MPYCKADDAQICEECGALIADGYQQVHRRMHPHPYDHDLYHDWASEPARHDCVMCRLPEDAPVHAGPPAK